MDESNDLPHCQEDKFVTNEGWLYTKNTFTTDVISEERNDNNNLVEESKTLPQVLAQGIPVRAYVDFRTIV